MIGSIGVSITHKQHKIIKSKLEKGFCTHAFGVACRLFVKKKGSKKWRNILSLLVEINKMAMPAGIIQI